MAHQSHKSWGLGLLCGQLGLVQKDVWGFQEAHVTILTDGAGKVKVLSATMD